jgi:hypothetical protein
MSGFDNYMNSYLDRRMKDIIEEWNLGTRRDFGDFTQRLGFVEKEIRELGVFEKGADARLAVLEQRLIRCREVRK